MINIVFTRKSLFKSVRQGVILKNINVSCYYGSGELSLLQ